MIKLTNVTKEYNGIGGKVLALKNASIHIGQGENVIIIGKSGSGKSTLLNIITGIDRADEGEIVVNGATLSSLSEQQLASWRGKNIGIVFQFYQLFPTLTAIDNLIFSMELVNVVESSKRRKRSEELLASMGLAHKAKKYPNELSGGEKQRVAIARALANDPPIIVADEPTGNLDSQTSEQIHQVFYQLNKEGKTIIKVTHEKVDHLHFTRLFHISDGVLATN